MNKKALITGISGQDGAYLSNFLLNKGYDVYGAVRRTSSINTGRLSELNVLDQINLVTMDLAEITNIQRVIEEVEPDEVYNLAAQSFVQTSFDQPIYTSEIDALGVTRILESIRMLGSKIKFYQASTSEMFGKHGKKNQDEKTLFHPRSPYATSKAFAHYTVQNYRESYNIHAVSGILFNHESPLRGEEFITRKITLGLAKIVLNKQKILKVGNIYSKRDWGYAGDYVEAMWKMMQTKKPKDYVIATSRNYSVKYFINQCTKILKLKTTYLIYFSLVSKN